MEPKYFLHEHPLHFFEEWSNNVHGKTRGVNCSSGCGQPISAQFYACIDCKFFLHKSCSELPLNITHPFHDNHPLTLLANAPYRAFCDFCGNLVNGFVYHCSSCKYTLDIKCALLPQFLNGDLPKVDHHFHVEHPLFYIENLSHEVKLASSRCCSVCLEQLSSGASFYTCLVCKLFLHKSCSETELPLNIDHPFHEKHTLTLTLLKSGGFCQFCRDFLYRAGLFYHCSSCRFNLHIKCAFLPQFLTGNFPKRDHHFSHFDEHPLFFIQKDIISSNKVELRSYHCFVCLNSLSDGSFYYCPECQFFLHKSCSETELPLNINHPFHEKHTLTLTPFKSDSLCQFCRNFLYRAGLFYHCSSCRFNLHIKCAFLPQFLTGNFPKRDHHFSDFDEHPLFFIQKDLISSNKVELYSYHCFVCLNSLSYGSFYYCPECHFFLHKSCSETELPLNINHPFHEKHTLTLTLLKRDSFCQFCRSFLYRAALFYHCSSCRFNLHIKCAFLPQFLTGNFPKRDHHFSDVDEHPLFFIQKDLISSNKVELYSYHCFVCQNSLSDSSFYYCPECQFFLHKSCVFEELPLKINHSLHDKHALTLKEGSRQWMSRPACKFCLYAIEGFRYSCSSCGFHLDHRCALLITKDLPKRDHHFSHVEHPLTFVQMLSNEVKINSSCSVCSKPLLGTSFYNCPDCGFFLHKECEAELWPKIEHVAHPEHPLIPVFSANYTCKFCQDTSHVKKIGYKCPSCFFYIHHECTLPRFFPESKIHDHQLSPFMRKNLFICDSCGGEGDDARYFCLKCSIMIHKDCIFLPKLIKFKLHNRHLLGHNYRLPQKEGEKRTCQFCFKKVVAEYGSYICLHLDCNYVLHGSCVKKNKGHLYIEVESENEESEEASSSSSSCAVALGDKIKHFSHKHELVLDEEEIIMNGDKKCCDGCALPILIAAYGCPQGECNFSLHKACAQIGKHKPHWASRDPLQVSMEFHFKCLFCKYDCSGFCFGWEGVDGIRREICLRCSEIPFITTHEAHAQHSLFCDGDHKGTCSGCGKEMVDGGYKCTLAEEEENCKFALDFRCLTRPLTAQHRFHHHPVKLTYEDPYKDDGDPSQHMCEICEDRRDPRLWFYRCDECDFDAHPDCVLGDFPFIKRGSISNVRCDSHQRPLIYFQSEKYPHPKCHSCGNPCKDLALKCFHSECNFARHFKCRN